MFQFGFGDIIKDSVTGAKGTVTGMATYITGCRKYCVEWGNKDGESKCEWLDEARVILVKSAKKPSDEKQVGGPTTNPPRA